MFRNKYNSCCSQNWKHRVLRRNFQLLFLYSKSVSSLRTEILLCNICVNKDTKEQQDQVQNSQAPTDI